MQSLEEVDDKDEMEDVPVIDEVEDEVEDVPEIQEERELESIPEIGDCSSSKEDEASELFEPDELHGGSTGETWCIACTGACETYC